MSKRTITTISIFVLSILFLLTAHVNAASVETKRLWGSDRYQDMCTNS